MTHLLELPIKSPHHQPGGDQIRLHAEGLAREIHHDVMASEAELADAIEAAIRRFAMSVQAPEAGLPPHVRDCRKCELRSGRWYPCKRHQPKPARSPEIR